MREPATRRDGSDASATAVASYWHGRTEQLTPLYFPPPLYCGQHVCVGLHPACVQSLQLAQTSFTHAQLPQQPSVPLGCVDGQVSVESVPTSLAPCASITASAFASRVRASASLLASASTGAKLISGTASQADSTSKELIKAAARIEGVYRRRGEAEEEGHQSGRAARRSERRRRSDAGASLRPAAGRLGRRIRRLEIAAGTALESPPRLRRRVSAARPASRTDARINVSSSPKYPALTVTVRGVGFFDFNHGQTGVAANAIELHPILEICFGAGCTPS